MDNDHEKNAGRAEASATDTDDGGKAAEAAVVKQAARVRYGRRAGDTRGDEAGTPIWLITVTDIMGLMLTFFVMLFAMAEPSQGNWSDMVSSLQGELSGHGTSAGNRGPIDARSLDSNDVSKALDLEYLHSLLSDIVNKNETLAGTQIIKLPRNLVLALPEELLFDSSHAVLTKKGEEVLYVLAESLSRIRNRIEISGHTDPRPMGEDSDGRFSSNWDLSLARSASVAGAMQGYGYDKEIDIVGEAGGRYDEIELIQEEQKRMGLARRVDIILLNHDGKGQ